MDTVIDNIALSLEDKKYQFQQKLEQLDMEPIVYKLMHHEDAPDWNLEEIDKNVELYKKFLLLNFIFPGGAIVPTKAIDTVWHYHILDTSKYMDDCQNLFGYFFHHFPYFGLRGAEDVQALADSFENTKLLFSEHFGIEFNPDAVGMDCRDDCISIPCGGPPDIKGEECQSISSKHLQFLLKVERPRPDR